MATPSVSLLDLAAASLSSAIVAADQIVTLARQDDATPDTDQKNIRLKNDGSFVTDADLAAQQIIVDAIRNVSPLVRIVGEEAEEEMQTNAITGHEERSQRMYTLCRQEIELRYHRQTVTHMPLSQATTTTTKERNDLDAKEHKDAQEGATTAEQSADQDQGTAVVSRDSVGVGMLQEPLQEFEVDPSRVSVFIDPLDGTKAYAKADYEPVSVLIAIILDKIPCFGVICKPFGYPGQTSVLDTGCVAIYGGTLLGGAYTAGGTVCNLPSPTSPPTEIPELFDSETSSISPLDSSNRPPPTVRSVSDTLDSPSSARLSMEDLPRAVISSSRSKGIVEDFVTHLGDRGMINPQPLLVSGAGEKSLRIILRSENEGLWFFPKAGTSLWDVAASDALLRATGGRLTDKNGNDMDYSKSRTEAENEDGVVACYDQRLHAECIRLFLEKSWHE
ncbi:inositol monophosphatase family protein [Nitzschia inconspicua]|uniref:3'(2'),5'-bisphosphate nucleotidase 1 n=1 Tax=Nitzschia inconspicua TaxID=303405 RepID=A0A9K3KM13_9STRA|nr:inositol monophosphatase family protein [Nitzschia inconspicua]